MKPVGPNGTHPLAVWCSLVFWHSCGDSVDQPHDCMFSLESFAIGIFFNLYKKKQLPVSHSEIIFVYMYNSIICNFIWMYNKLSFTASLTNLLITSENLQLFLGVLQQKAGTHIGVETFYLFIYLLPKILIFMLIHSM